MQSPHRLDRSTRPQRVSRPARRCRVASTAPDATSRQQWVAACSNRLASLQPEVNAEELRALAEDLWLDLKGHDPEIAAEMEQESRRDG